jgi:SAM-dependent methyltransferase
VRRGIPFSDGTFDVVYHSHFLEHVEREAAPVFLRETLRVLKPGGTTRVVVPDLKVLVDRYLESWEALERSGGDGMASHRASIHELFDQMVRRELTGAAHQPGPLRALERRLRGDAAGAGELHRWMYDRHTLVVLLESVGFSAVKVERADTSRIPGWNEYRLDTEPDGRVYKPESLFVEASKP